MDEMTTDATYRVTAAEQSAKNVEEIQKMLPDEFNKKLREWEELKDQQQHHTGKSRRPR